MKTPREEFEELTGIKGLIKHEQIYWSDESDCYIAEDFDFDIDAIFANGAWYAYQEQHKKVEVYRKAIELQNAFDKANILMFGAFHHGENVIHVGTIDNPNQTLTINVDENGNIETSNHNGDGK